MNTDAFLVGLSIVLLVPCLLSVTLLVQEANKKPRIGALTERAVIGVDIAVMVVSGVLITLNRITGYAFFAVDVARMAFLGSLVLLEFVPVFWLYLLATRRLGDGGKG